MSLFFRLISLLVGVSLLAGCSSSFSAVTAKKALHSEKPRQVDPQVPPEDSLALSSGNRAFAIDLYQQLPKTRNLFFSPYSISLALAMTYGGARGETEKEMADALHFDLPQERLHPAFNKLEQDLASRKDVSGQGADGKGFRLNIVNDLWGQADYTFLPAYLDLLAMNYDAGMRLVDFVKDSEAARQEINRYVSDQTEKRIKDLVPPGAVNEMTRLVLTNAIYFNAAWLHPFDASQTETAPFTRLDGSQVDVQMMAQPAYQTVLFGTGDGYQVVALPYENSQLVMWLVVPDAGRFEEFEAGLNLDRLDTILNTAGPTSVLVSMPRFQVEDEFQLREPLLRLGMGSAFDPGQADLSGINGTSDLYISEVVHKSFVKVDEAGTEAAAATAVIVMTTGMPAEIVELKIDRPFLFFISDLPTQTILFMGRMLEPADQ